MTKSFGKEAERRAVTGSEPGPGPANRSTSFVGMGWAGIGARAQTLGSFRRKFSGFRSRWAIPREWR